ncbi:MAG: hydrogenase, Fe-only [Paenibacillaceae bacterium]|nr:hydrogenase, Fe-only [Paenibacillaceae bacterium]
MAKEVKLTINDVELTVPADYTILDAAKTINVKIPTLCHLNLHELNMNSVNQVASCRVCLVEQEGRNNLVPSCATYVTDGMKIKTSSPRSILARRTMVELLLSDHPFDCLVCEKNQTCDLQALAADLGVRGELKYQGAKSTYPKDVSSKAIYRNLDKCILCRRCETMCNQVQTCGILSAVGRGFETVVAPAFGMPMTETMCTYCGQCVAVCPTAALTEVNNISGVWDALASEDKHVIVQTAPAVRVALGEEFGMEAGNIVTGKMVAALRRLGFHKVFDTDFAADLTIIEEAAEMVHRIEHGGRLPILTSCCPAWVKFFEHQFPELLDIPSTCKSPHEMFGAIAKTYYAQKFNIDPAKIVVVSIMPCLAKKYEAARGELSHDGLQDVDYVITTRELAMMIRETGISFRDLPDEEFDHPLGESTGAGVIFGTTGGVIEAALRTAHEWITGKPLEQVDFHQLRGFQGVREAEVDIDGRQFRIGVAHGLGNARTMLESIQAGEVHYDAIEIMACPGGCVGGGGQPYHHGDQEIIKKRSAAIYAADKDKPRRKSHENEEVMRIYAEYLGEIYGEKAHELLHTHYTARELI